MKKYIHNFLTKIICKFVKDNQCLNNELVFLCKKYYDDKFNAWKKSHYLTLIRIENQLKHDASAGLSRSKIILFCDYSDNDCQYYEKWFRSNKLNYTKELLDNQICNEVNRYVFEIMW